MHGNLETVGERKAIPGGTACRYHGGGAQDVKGQGGRRSSGAPRMGPRDATVDPGEVLLRLVTQSAARAERYAMLVEEAYEAAERLKRSFDAGVLEIDEGKEMAETARGDLDRIFNTGGVAALVGNAYEPRRTSGFTSPAKRSEALLLLKRRSGSDARTFASKAVAAGLVERTVRVAERQGQLLVEMGSNRTARS
jgi:hypothetical protein